MAVTILFIFGIRIFFHHSNLYYNHNKEEYVSPVINEYLTTYWLAVLF